MWKKFLVGEFIPRNEIKNKSVACIFVLSIFRVPMYGTSEQHKDIGKHLMEMYRVVLSLHSVTLLYYVASIQ